MTDDGKVNGYAHGTGQFAKVDKPGMTEPIVEQARLCTRDAWCPHLEGHEGKCPPRPERWGPSIPPPGWYLTLPPPRIWCRFCGWPAPTIAEAGVVRIGPHTVDGVACGGENTLASDHPKFRG